jgi:hypothetical protein
LELHSEEAPKYHAKKLLDEIITEVEFHDISFDADLVRAAIDLSQDYFKWSSRKCSTIR